MSGNVEYKALFVALLMITSLGAAPYETAHCRRVIDGDTIELSTGECVRYIGVDTLEARGKLGNVIAEYNCRLVEGKNVRLEFDEEKYDKYDRLLAYVYVDGIFVNAMLVKHGLARVMTVPPNVRYKKYFQQLEKEAKEHKRGIWAE